MSDIVERTLKGCGWFNILVGAYLLLSILPLMAMNYQGSFFYHYVSGTWGLCLGFLLLRIKLKSTP